MCFTPSPNKRRASEERDHPKLSRKDHRGEVGLDKAGYGDQVWQPRKHVDHAGEKRVYKSDCWVSDRSTVKRPVG